MINSEFSDKRTTKTDNEVLNNNEKNIVKNNNKTKSDVYNSMLNCRRIPTALLDNIFKNNSEDTNNNDEHI